MERHVFISFLGTSNYSKTIYQFENGHTSKPVRYIQEALIDEIASDWTEDDQIIIFVTEKSKLINWDSNNNIDDATQPIRLEQILDQLKQNGLKPAIKAVTIKEGFTENEIWDIFDTIYNQINNNDQVYLDVTNALRSIPLFSLPLFNYASFLKESQLQHLYYGAYEKILSDKQKGINDSFAPIIDLKGIIQLQKMTIAANNFNEFGRLGKMTELISVSSETNNSKIKQQNQRLKKNIAEFENQIITCRGKKIVEGNTANDIKLGIQEIIDLDLPEPIKILLRQLKREIDDFQQNDLINIIRAIEWCKQYKLIQAAYTLGQEGIITLLAQKMNNNNFYLTENDGKNADRQFRDYISSILGIGEQAKDMSNWKSPLTDNINLTVKLLGLPEMIDLRKEYGKLTTNRNQINHGGFTGNISAESLIKQFNQPFDKCIQIINNFIFPESDICQPQSKQRLLINLSNHPYHLWKDPQKAKAEVYGKCIDMAFPAVSSTASKSDIDSLSNEFLLNILEYTSTYEVTIHLMGEMTFCFSLLQKLNKLHIPAIASTTERICKESNNSTKESVFDFIRFREY